MGFSGVTKFLGDGALVITDGGAKTMTLNYTGGDFSIDGLQEGNMEVTEFTSRGLVYCLRKTKQALPTIKFTAHFTDLTETVAGPLYDLATKLNYWAGGTSTYTAGDVWCVNMAWTIAGTALGDAKNSVLTVPKVHIIAAISEGEPNMYSITGVVYAAVTAT